MWQTPKFWFQPKGLFAFLLWPLSLLYMFATLLRTWVTFPYKGELPVICIGNATVGGAGKTPTVLALIHLFQKKKINVVCLSRGYGGFLKGPLLVDSSRHVAAAVGDEPLLLAQEAPTYIAKDRIAGLRTLQESEACVLMDDGYQNPSIYKDTNVLVIDGPRGFGNGFIFPAGPLREPFSFSIKRADAIVVIGIPCPSLEPILQSLPQPIFYATLQPRDSVKPLLNQKFVAFCGLANPAKFFATLKENQIPIVQEIVFPDHYLFENKDMENLISIAQKLDAHLITTEKDWVRLRKEYRPLVISFPVVLQWQDESQVAEFFLQRSTKVS